MEESANLVMTVLCPKIITECLQKCRILSYEEAKEVLCRAWVGGT